MKTFFLFRTSSAYPNEARTIKFRTKPEALRELQSLVSRDAWFFDHKCCILANKPHDRITVREYGSGKTIETKVIRCDIDDNIPFYYHM